MEALVQNLSIVAADVQQMKITVQGEIATATASINQLQGQAGQHQQEMQAAMAVSEGIKADSRRLMEEVNNRLLLLEQQATTSSGSSQCGKAGWTLTRPKDLVPDVFNGKEEEWLRWKEATEDYAEAVHPGLKHAMAEAARAKDEITYREQLTGVQESEWVRNAALFTLLKTKTTSEPKTLVTSAIHDNGLESWRILVGRFEPQAGIKRMKEVSDLMSLQNKRCKNAAETALILTEMGRRQKLIADLQGNPLEDEMLVNVLWMAMDPGTRSHVSGKLDGSKTIYFQAIKKQS